MGRWQFEAIDRTPFATSEAAAQVAQALAGEAVAQGARAAGIREMKARIAAWAERRGFALRESDIVTEIDGVSVRVPSYAITEGTALVHADALAPAKGVVVVEPRSFTDRLFRRGVSTGDEAFDARFKTTAPHAAAAAAHVDEDVREAMREVLGWARATYEDGRVKIELDADGMCGARVLEGIALACALARTRAPTTAAYR